MANKLISEAGLPTSIANVFTARNLLTAKEALSLPEFDLALLLGLPVDDTRSAVALISHAACPPCHTVLTLMEERVRSENSVAHLPTMLSGLDEALCGGVPAGSLIELVGPAGIGKTQFCLKLSLIAALPASVGGLNGRVIYIDTESKFSPRRLIEIGENSFPDVFHAEGMAKEMAGRIVVMRPTSLSEFTESLQQIKLSLLHHEVKLVIIDSMAALASREKTSYGHNALGCPLSFLKSLAELSRIPIVVTNQVRGQNTNNDSYRYNFEGQNRNLISNPDFIDYHLVAALGVQWAHAVMIRLILEAHSGQRFIKVAKSPISPPLAFPFIVDASGISLLQDDGILISGPEINAIRSQDHSISTDEGRLHEDKHQMPC